MSVKVYLKGSVDIGLGPGVCFMEFIDDVVVRQCERHGRKWYSSRDRDYHDDLGPSRCDRPLEEVLEYCELATQEEFEQAWAQANSRQSDH